MDTRSLITMQYANTLEVAEQCAKIADQWTGSPNCNVHTDDPCCHRRTGAMIAKDIRRKFQLDGEAS